MAKLFRYTKLGTVNLNEGKTESILLPRTVINFIDLKLEVDATVNTAFDGKYVPYLFKQILREINVELNGSDNRVNLDAIQLRRLVQLDYNQTPSGVVDTGSTGSKKWNVFIRIPFDDPKGINPEETALDTRSVSSAILQLTMGTPSSVGLDATINNALVSIHIGEMVNVDHPTLERRISATTEQLQIGENTIYLPYGGGNGYKQILLLGWANDGTNIIETTQFIKTVRVRKRANTIHYFDRDAIMDLTTLENDGNGRLLIPFERYGKHARALTTDDTTEFALEIVTEAVDGLSDYKIDIIRDTIRLPKGE